MEPNGATTVPGGLPSAEVFAEASVHLLRLLVGQLGLVVLGLAVIDLCQAVQSIRLTDFMTDAGISFIRLGVG